MTAPAETVSETTRVWSAAEQAAATEETVSTVDLGSRTPVTITDPDGSTLTLRTRGGAWEWVADDGGRRVTVAVSSSLVLRAMAAGIEAAA